MNLWDRIFGVDPTNLEDAIEYLFTGMNKGEKDLYVENGYSAYHHGFGTQLRNEWGLWNTKSKMSQFFRTKYGLGHADDMSGMIMRGLEAKIKGETVDFDAEADYYKRFWLLQFIDPLSQTRIEF